MSITTCRGAAPLNILNSSLDCNILNRSVVCNTLNCSIACNTLNSSIVCNILTSNSDCTTLTSNSNCTTLNSSIACKILISSSACTRAEIYSLYDFVILVYVVLYYEPERQVSGRRAEDIIVNTAKPKSKMFMTRFFWTGSDIDHG